MRTLKPNYYIKGIYYLNSHLIKFKKANELISEEDIFSLFNGFVRLIKKSVELEMEDKYINRISHLEKELKKYKAIK